MPAFTSSRSLSPLSPVLDRLLVAPGPAPSRLDNAPPSSTPTLDIITALLYGNHHGCIPVSGPRRKSRYSGAGSSPPPAQGPPGSSPPCDPMMRPTSSPASSKTGLSIFMAFARLASLPESGRTRIPAPFSSRPGPIPFPGNRGKRTERASAKYSVPEPGSMPFQPDSKNRLIYPSHPRGLNRP